MRRITAIVGTILLLGASARIVAHRSSFFSGSGTFARIDTSRDSPVPTGAHPRLFMSPPLVTAYSANVAARGTAARSLVDTCNESIADPRRLSSRESAGLNAWPQVAMACAFSYRVTGRSSHLEQAIRYWRTTLDDDWKVGDARGCTRSALLDEGWKEWNGWSRPVPAVLAAVAHDTGYPMRAYGPFTALTYDWLHDAPGVDEALRAQTRSCLTAWMDHYTQKGYLRSSPGKNYHAGFIVGKVLAAVAIGDDGGADGHLWTEAIHGVFATDLVKKGLAPSPPGLLVGGDWGSWQYGPLSVAEYALAARAMREHGAPQPEMVAWLRSLALRHVYAQLPTPGTQHAGNGDLAASTLYPPNTRIQFDAILLGDATDDVAGWAAYLKSISPAGDEGLYGVLAEVRAVKPVDYRSRGSPPRWYLAAGTQSVFARSDWSPQAVWAVFMGTSLRGNADTQGPDHAHFAASNFVLTRGADPLVVDASNYDEMATNETNALNAESALAVDTPNYAQGQTPWGSATLAWARSASGIVAARSDLARAYDYASTHSDVPYAHRDWTFLPEGEVVIIDRVRSPGAAYGMKVRFHIGTGPGGLGLSGGAYIAVAGRSKIAIHPVYLTNGSPAVSSIPAGACRYESLGCTARLTCSRCDAARVPTGLYVVRTVGAWNVAVHVIDALGASESPAITASLSSDPFNAAVVGASVLRGGVQSYVVASSAQDGAAGASMTYRVPGANSGRHVVFDAPEDANGRSSVAAMATGTECSISITPGAGFTGHPLMFSVGPAPTCSVTELPDAPPAS